MPPAQRELHRYAEDADLLVTSEIFPLAEAFAAVRHAFDRESEHQRRLARIFNCA
jgi:hypothetical protein